MMKKYLFLGMMSAVALTFTACSSEDEVANVNPTFDGESVKTTFSISMGNVKGATRMDANAVQADNALHGGLTDIYLFPAKTADSDTKISGTTEASEGYIKLPDFTHFDEENAGATGKYYQDITFSVGVNQFLFYAATATSNKDNGELKPSYLEMAVADYAGNNPWLASSLEKSTAIGSITFDLVPYQGGKTIEFLNGDGADASAKATIKAMNDVDKALSDQITAAAVTNIKNALIELQRSFRNDQSHDGKYNETHTTDYKEFAASSASVKALMTKLYNALKNMKDALTSGSDNYAKPILDLIADGASGNIFTAVGTPETGYTLTWNTDPGFPANLKLPEGAVAQKFNGTKFEFFEIVATTPDPLNPNPADLIAQSIGKYVHPARLYYTVNTAAMIKNTDYLSLGEHSALDWTAIKGSTGGNYQKAAIKSDTRSVILEDQVKYAVARLDVQVRVRDDQVIYDSGSGIPGDAYINPQPVTVPQKGYPLSGVLIGGQKQVDWQFQPCGTKAYTIYDDHMTEYSTPVYSASTTPAMDKNYYIVAKKGTAYSDANHTLALETAAGEEVRIALEFINTGNDFYGINNNLIPAGGKFYLIAKLTPGTNEISNPDGLTQVFKQDFTTTAKLAIGSNSLKSAYNVIPDLRASKLEFGLSVDLTWQNGITFEQDF